VLLLGPNRDVPILHRQQVWFILFTVFVGRYRLPVAFFNWSNLVQLGTDPTLPSEKVAVAHTYYNFSTQENIFVTFRLSSQH
jgi:hypothetical protein